MSIQPMDLQTLFIKMNDVSKEQALLKENIGNQQELMGNEIIKKQHLRDSSVNEAKSSGNGLDKTDENGSGSQGKSKDKGATKEEKEKQDIKKIELTVDPYLGKHLDISG